MLLSVYAPGVLCNAELTGGRSVPRVFIDGQVRAGRLGMCAMVDDWHCGWVAGTASPVRRPDAEEGRRDSRPC